MSSEVDLQQAFKIAENMARPWEYATAVLSAVIAGLLFYLCISETTVDVKSSAKEVTAALLETSTDFNGE